MKCGFLEIRKDDQHVSGENRDFTCELTQHIRRLPLFATCTMFYALWCWWRFSHPSAPFKCELLPVGNTAFFRSSQCLPHGWRSMIFVGLNYNPTSDVKSVSTGKLFNLSGGLYFHQYFPEKNEWRVNPWTNERDWQNVSFASMGIL